MSLEAKAEGWRAQASIINRMRLLPLSLPSEKSVCVCVCVSILNCETFKMSQYLSSDLILEDSGSITFNM